MRVKRNIRTYTSASDIHGYNTRARNNLAVPYNRLTKSQKHFECQGLRMLNGLPLHVRDLSIGKFERVLHGWVVENPFYTLDEYFDTNF